MSHAALPSPDAGPAVTPAPPSASSQLAGILELLRIAELQAQGYARDAPAGPIEEIPGSGTPPSGLALAECQGEAATVPE